MAYSDYGAFVYKNGQRQRDKEDVPVFGDPEVEAAPSGARIWVNLLKARQGGTLDTMKPHEHLQHAVLGGGKFRLCARKTWPVLFIARDDGTIDQLDMAEYRVDKSKSADDWDWSDSEGIAGEIEGHKFSAWPLHADTARCVLELVEPDGTKWTATSGYQHGAGHDDD